MNSPLNDKDTKHESYIKQQAKCLRRDLHLMKKVFVLVWRSAGLTLKPLGSSPQEGTSP